MIVKICFIDSTQRKGLAAAAEFGKRQPGLLLIENTKDDDKNYYLALFVQQD